MERQPPIIAVLTDRYFPYQAKIIENIAAELNSLGYGVLCITARELIAASNPNQANAVSNSIYPQVNQFGIHGLIALSGTIGYGVDTDTVKQFLNSYPVPKVSLGMNIPGVASVYFEEYNGMSDLMDHLLESGARQRFAFVRGHPNDPCSLEREKIFTDALHSQGHAPEDIFYLKGNYNPYTTYKSVTELLTTNSRIDCIVAANDVMAASAARAAKAHGLNIPTDIAITGFDDSSDATRHSPALTTVRQPVGKMAHDSVNLLIQQIEQHAIITDSTATSFETPISHFIGSNSELIVRRSTKSADAELEAIDSLDEVKLRSLLNNAMFGLEIPKQLTMQQISEPMWRTLKYGSIDLVTLASELSDTIIFQHAHWWVNLFDQVHSINVKLLASNYNKANIALISSAISEVKERIWSLELDRKFEETRLQNVRSDMQLAMSSCNDITGILSAMDTWLTVLNPPRCFLIRYQNAGATPDTYAQLIHAFKDGQSQSPSNELFESKDVLPTQMANELASGLLVLSPVYADNMLFGYLLIDPIDIGLYYIDDAARCIGNAMRTHHHIKALHAQKDSLQSVNAELAHLANYDALTGLANRLRFQHYLTSCTEKSDELEHSFALLYIDLDGFKLVNDTLGHSVGDLLLKQVAQRLLKGVSDSPYYDGFISRLGGDEFTVILHAINESADIQIINQQLLELLSSPYMLNENENENEVSISASIGCALYPENAKNANELETHADIAMYRAKDSGKNTITLFNPNMIRADAQELQLAQELRAALANNILSMHYQPRIDLKTGRICAAEALMRWLVPTSDGLVTRAYPDVFIALAEKIGVISQLDTYALHYSCRQAAKWASNGTPLQISVNVSVNQLQQDNFVSTIMNAIKQHQLDPSLLELEITETAAMTDVENNIAKLSQIKAAGIEVSIDDFGTGYSSLNYLKRLPVRNLKIDRSFIMDIVESDGGNSADAAIVRSVVALGKSMDFGLIAEGIETEAQHKFICSLECDQAQGYLYAKPLTEEDITAMLNDNADQLLLEQLAEDTDQNNSKAA